MALTGVFNADFSPFSKAVDGAVLKLRDIEAGSAKVETAFNRVANSYSGAKTIQEATLVAQVFERAGGEAAFTERELARMGATGAEAVAKLKALGQEVPAGLQKMADATREETSLLGSVKDALGPLAGAFGIAFSVGGVVALGRELVGVVTHAVTVGSTLDNLSKSSGLSTDMLQALGVKGAEVGLSMDTLAMSASQLAARIAGDDASAQKAAEALGLSFARLKTQSIDQMLIATLQALTQETDATKQALIAKELYGKQGLQLLGMIRDNKDGLVGLIAQMKAANLIIDHDSIGALDRWGDAFGRLMTKAEKTGATVTAFMLNSVTAQRSGLAFGAVLPPPASPLKAPGVDPAADTKLLQIELDARVAASLKANEEFAKAWKEAGELDAKDTKAVNDAKQQMDDAWRDFHEKTLIEAAKNNAKFNADQLALLKINQEDVLASVASMGARLKAEQVGVFDMMTGKASSQDMLEQISAAQISPFLAASSARGADQAKEEQKGFGASWSKYMSKDFGQIIVGAAQGGGSVWKSVGTSIGSQLGSSVSEAIERANIGKSIGMSVVAGLASMGISLAMWALMKAFETDAPSAAAAPVMAAQPIAGQGATVIHVNNVVTLDGRVVTQNVVQHIIGNSGGSRTGMQQALGIA